MDEEKENFINDPEQNYFGIWKLEFMFGINKVLFYPNIFFMNGMPLNWYCCLNDMLNIQQSQIILRPNFSAKSNILGTLSADDTTSVPFFMSSKYNEYECSLESN